MLRLENEKKVKFNLKLSIFHQLTFLLPFQLSNFNLCWELQDESTLLLAICQRLSWRRHDVARRTREWKMRKFMICDWVTDIIIVVILSKTSSLVARVFELSLLSCHSRLKCLTSTIAGQARTTRSNKNYEYIMRFISGKLFSLPTYNTQKMSKMMNAKTPM